jgi:hypothetical protein
MTWMRAIGGPHHDEWFNVKPGWGQHLVVPGPRELRMFTGAFILDQTTGIDPGRIAYTVQRLVWPGFRFPLRVLIAPGVQVHGHPEPYDSSWPNPLVPARCRCEEIEAFPPWVFARHNTSACHLDHCPLHGRWTFPLLTPMSVSVDARDAWLARREGGSEPSETALTLRDTGA